MSFEEAIKQIPIGVYRHYKGNMYQVLGIAKHSESSEPMVVYCNPNNSCECWVCPAKLWYESKNGNTKRFTLMTMQ